ncbi:MAG TPA: hypothetical protein VIL36_09310 [Acidimicrobiales bacterium]
MRDISIEVAGNLIAAVILAVAAAMAWLFSTRPRLRRLQALFGIDQTRPVVAMYLSNLAIQPGGAASRDGEPDVAIGFTGPAIIRSEYRAAQIVERLLTGGRLLVRPKGLNEWLRGRLPTLSVPDVRIDVAPDPFQQRAAENLVLLGSRVYNSLTAHYFEDNPLSYFSFDRVPDPSDPTETLRVIRIAGRTEPVPVVRATVDGRGTELAIVERLLDEENDRIIFAIYGFGAASTAGATRFLAEHWEDFAELVERFGPRVGVLMAFDNYPRDIERGEELDVLHNRPRILFVRTPSSTAELEPGKQTLSDFLRSRR